MSFVHAKLMHVYFLIALQIENTHETNRMETQCHPLSDTVNPMATRGLCHLKHLITILGQEQLIILQ